MNPYFRLAAGGGDPPSPAQLVRNIHLPASDLPPARARQAERQGSWVARLWGHRGLSPAGLSCHGVKQDPPPVRQHRKMLAAASQASSCPPQPQKMGEKEGTPRSAPSPHGGPRAQGTPSPTVSPVMPSQAHDTAAHQELQIVALLQDPHPPWGLSVTWGETAGSPWLP